MVEKITVNPEKIRGYGNVLMSKNASDYDTYESTVTKTTDTVYGATETVFNMSPINYNLAFSQSTYTPDMFGDASVSCTLKNGNTPMSGETITFTYEGMFGPLSVTATTNSSGVATHTFSEYDFPSLPATVTATYSGATATCTIEGGGGII